MSTELLNTFLKPDALFVIPQYFLTLFHPIFKIFKVSLNKSFLECSGHLIPSALNEIQNYEKSLGLNSFSGNSHDSSVFCQKFYFTG